MSASRPIQDTLRNLDEDVLYGQAVAVVRENDRASTSLVQRHLRVRYNLAARLLERMEREGVVSVEAPNGKRVVLEAAK